MAVASDAILGTVSGRWQAAEPERGKALAKLRVLSTHLFLNQRLHPGLLEMAGRAGAEAVEIFAARQHFDYTSRESVAELGHWFRSNPLQPWSMHAPLYPDREMGRAGAPAVNVLHPEKSRRIDAMDEIKRAIEVAEKLPFRYLVQHVGNSTEEFDMHKFDAALTSIEHLRAFAKPLGVRMLVENIPNELSTPEKLKELLRVGHFGDVGVCFDTGHAHMMGGVAPALELLKDDIRSTHVHDNKQDRDAHLWPGEGTIDWKLTMELLQSAPQIPPVLLEIEGDPEGNPEFGKKIPELARKSWKTLGMLAATFPGLRGVSVCGG
jgi:sugar phosphate isomerase/epimerase